ncbi:MAG: Gfo/Idh/MocA family oxidoreductase [Ignavibacteriae bacterium]|nr:Gfo/Idh/MocA family oxidoreductase [Ignavibacteriota bacterium]
MTNAPLRIGVIGLGHLGSLHAKMLSQSRNAVLSALFDTDAAKRETVSTQLGAPAVDSIDALFDAVDAVSIATPTTTHFEIASRAIERGLHVFIEKPVTKTVEEARALNSLAAQHGRLIQVGHIERFNPAIVALDNHALAPLFVESHRLAQFNPRGTDVAVVLDLMIHDIDIILSLVKSEVTDIDASGVAVVSGSADIANARLKFANGCVANITASRISQSRMRKMRLFQRDAYISIDFLQGTSGVFRLVDADAAGVVPTPMLGQIEQGSVKRTIIFEQPPAPANHNPLAYELQLFVDAALGGAPPVVDGLAGQQALEVAERIVAMIGDARP